MDANPVETVSALCELFAQVDVDGNRLMDWEEFTSFCIEAGAALSKFKQGGLNTPKIPLNQCIMSCYCAGCAHAWVRLVM